VILFALELWEPKIIKNPSNHLEVSDATASEISSEIVEAWCHDEFVPVLLAEGNSILIC